MCCGGKVRRKPQPANGAARPHPHRDAWRGARMRGGELNRTATPGRTPEAAAGMSAGAAAGKRRRTTASAPGRMTRGTNAGGAEPHGGSRHRRRPARPHRAAHDDRRHYRPPRRHLTAAELPALCGDAGTMREKRGTCGRPPRTAEKAAGRPDPAACDAVLSRTNGKPSATARRPRLSNES